LVHSQLDFDTFAGLEERLQAQHAADACWIAFSPSPPAGMVAAPGLLAWPAPGGALLACAWPPGPGKAAVNAMAAEAELMMVRRLRDLPPRAEVT